MERKRTRIDDDDLVRRNIVEQDRRERLEHKREPIGACIFRPFPFRTWYTFRNDDGSVERIYR